MCPSPSRLPERRALPGTSAGPTPALAVPGEPSSLPFLQQGCPTSGVFGPHAKYTTTNKNKSKQSHVLSKCAILCWATCSSQAVGWTPLPLIEQSFSSHWWVLASRGPLARSGDICDCRDWEALRDTGGQRAEVLLSVLQCTGQPPSDITVPSLRISIQNSLPRVFVSVCLSPTGTPAPRGPAACLSGSLFVPSAQPHSRAAVENVREQRIPACPPSEPQDAEPVRARP